MTVEKFVRIKFEKGKDLEDIGDRLRKLGWTNLNIRPYHDSPSGEDKTEDGFCCKWCLRGCPPDYEGTYSDYSELLAVTLHKNWFGEIIYVSMKKDIANIF